MKLGSDFNAAAPPDGGFVRRPTGPQLASEIRGIRGRLRDFFGTVFNLGSGDLKDSVLPASALLDHPADPAGENFRQVEVDSRGFVVRGLNEPAYTAPRMLRAVFTATGGWMDLGEGYKTVPMGVSRQFAATEWGGDGNPGHRAVEAVQYEFITPPKVRRLSVLLIGGRFAGLDPVSKCSVCTIPTFAGEVWSAAVSTIDCDSVFFRAGTLDGIRSDGFVPEGSLFGVIKGQLSIFARPYYRGYGRDTSVAAGTSPGLIVVDCYA